MTNNLQISVSKTNKNFYVYVYDTSNGHHIISLTSNDSFFKRYFQLENMNKYFLFGNILKYKCLNYGIHTVSIQISGKYSKNIKFFLDGFYS